MKPKSKSPTLQDLLDQIREIQITDELQEGDLTIARVCTEFKCGRTKARKYLDQLSEKGIVKQERVTGNAGKVTNVWRAK